MFVILLLNLTLLMAQDQTRVDELDLSKFSVQISKACTVTVQKDSFGKEIVYMNEDTKKYYNSLSDLDKKIYIRLAKINFLQKTVDTKPFIMIVKKDGLFYMESLAHVDISLKEAMSVISNFSDYHSWLLKDINVRRGGKTGSYFVDFLSMRFVEEGSYWDFLVRMNSFFGGLYTIAFNIENKVNERPVPNFGMHIKESSNLAKTMNGYFRFLHLPCEDTFFVGYFYGDTKLHWMLYDILPIAVVNSQIGERIETMLENINYKAEDVIIQKRRTQRYQVTKNNN